MRGVPNVNLLAINKGAQALAAQGKDRDCKQRLKLVVFIFRLT